MRKIALVLISGFFLFGCAATSTANPSDPSSWKPVGGGLEFRCHNTTGVYRTDVHYGHSIAAVDGHPECRVK